MANRCVFRRRLKVPSVSDAVTLDGKVFQARGAATKNARSPIVVRHEDVTRADEDRSLFLVSTSATRRSLLARYGGAVPCRHRKMSTESLNSIRSGIFTYTWTKCDILIRDRNEEQEVKVIWQKAPHGGAHSPVRGHPRGSKVVPLNSWGRVSY